MSLNKRTLQRRKTPGDSGQRSIRGPAMLVRSQINVTPGAVRSHSHLGWLAKVVVASRITKHRRTTEMELDCWKEFVSRVTKFCRSSASIAVRGPRISAPSRSPSPEWTPPASIHRPWKKPISKGFPPNSRPGGPVTPNSQHRKSHKNCPGAPCLFLKHVFEFQSSV